MAKQGKLELTWVGKDERVRLEPPVLVEDPARSYGDPDAGNVLIYRGNLLALNALEQDFAGRIKVGVWSRALLVRSRLRRGWPVRGQVSNGGAGTDRFGRWGGR